MSLPTIEEWSTAMEELHQCFKRRNYGHTELHQMHWTYFPKLYKSVAYNVAQLLPHLVVIFEYMNSYHAMHWENSGYKGTWKPISQRGFDRQWIHDVDYGNLEYNICYGLLCLRSADFRCEAERFGEWLPSCLPWLASEPTVHQIETRADVIEIFLAAFSGDDFFEPIWSELQAVEGLRLT